MVSSERRYHERHNAQSKYGIGLRRATSAGWLPLLCVA